VTADDALSVDLPEDELRRIGRTLAIGQLAPGVIHEINNPLFAILGILEFLLADAEPGTKTRERLQLVQQSGLEIKDVVRTLMDFARESQDERVELALDDVTKEAIELFRRTSASHDVEVGIETGPGPLLVHGNRNALKVILLNVLVHASRALPRGGGAVHVRVARVDAAVTATVTYAGSGAATEPGADLALTLAGALARRHGGELAPERAGDPPSHSLVLALPATAPA
jgi:two-component system sensor histidine kinase HydH